MNNYTYFIGIDISKSKLDICVLESKKVMLEHCIENTQEALKAFQKQLRKMKITPANTLVCCEHTGIYASDLIHWSNKSGYGLWLEKAIQIKRSIGMQRGKNDKVDAYRIGIYAYRYCDQAVVFKRPRKEIELLKNLLTIRQRLLKVKKQLQVPLQELQCIDGSIYKNIASVSKKSIQAIKNDLQTIDAQIQQIIKQDESIRKTVNFATSVDGVGVITAISMVVATNEFQYVQSGKQLACYVGVVPFTHQSGSSVLGKDRVSHLANKPLKTLLHLGAISAKTYVAEFRAYYERKIAEGKHKMSVINAIRNKMVRRLYVCVTQGKMYEKK